MSESQNHRMTDRLKTAHTLKYALRVYNKGADRICKKQVFYEVALI